MLQQQRLNNKGEQFVIGPTGIPLTLADLPPANTQRWVIRRKAEVVAAVRGGLLSFDEACDRYKLTNEEFGAWQKSIDSHGLAGLRTTRIQHTAKTYVQGLKTAVLWGGRFRFNARLG